jgi:predicted DNA-binding WGR domain protein
MTLYPFQLYCQRVDQSKNMARYYALSLQPTLFGETAVVRQWGRIGKRGGEKSEVFATEREAASHLLQLARKKRRKGYRPVGTCGNASAAPAAGSSR